MECRKFFRATSITALTFFNKVLARTCDRNEYTYFSGPSGIYYYILRYCLSDGLAGGIYFDRAMETFPRQCSANLNVGVWEHGYESLVGWDEGYVEFGRGAEQNTSSTFEQCVTAIFGEAQARQTEDSKSIDHWTGVGIGIFVGLIFLGVIICVVGGTICERNEKRKKAEEAEQKKIHQVEEIIIPEITSSPVEESSDSATSTVEISAEQISSSDSSSSSSHTTPKM